MKKEILKRERLHRPLSSVLAGFYSVPAHLRVRAGLPPFTASLSPTAGPICQGRLPPILPLLCARVVTLVKLLLLSRPLVTTSAPQCRHLYQPAVRESCDSKPLVCSVRLRWLNRGMVWERLQWLNPQGTRRGFWVGAMLMLAVKPQWVRCKLDEIIEQSCSDFLTHTLEVCKRARRYNEYSAI
jgi:hypothetical protein